MKFDMIERRESFENCFCVSMLLNCSNDYSIALRFTPAEVFCDIKDEAMLLILTARGQPWSSLRSMSGKTRCGLFKKPKFRELSIREGYLYEIYLFSLKRQ
ncbi:MAG: hypothetical protein ACM3X9_06615 [Bacillota bacterium]